jgi:hydrogenase maturation protease
MIRGTTMVLGLGNLVHGDDGVGVHAIARLQRDDRVPTGLVLLDGGTHGLGLLPYISEFRRLIVVDAVNVGEAPGTVIRMEGDALRGMPGKPTAHQLGFTDMLVAMKLLGDAPDEVVLLGVQPASTEWSPELSPPVEAALTTLIESILSQLDVWRHAPLAELVPQA